MINADMYADHVFGKADSTAAALSSLATRNLPSPLVARWQYYLEDLRVDGAGTRSRCILAPTHLVGETAIDLGGRVLKLKANEAPPQIGEVYGRVQSG